MSVLVYLESENKVYRKSDLETTADGTKGESEGRDQREKAFLRVDDKK
jgi:hypothetical protein